MTCATSLDSVQPVHPLPDVWTNHSIKNNADKSQTVRITAFIIIAITIKIIMLIVVVVIVVA